MLPFHRQLRDPVTLVWAGLILLFGVLLCSLPLTGSLGYESTLALAPVAALLGSHLMARCVALVRRSDEGLLLAPLPPYQVLATLLWRGLALSGLVLAIAPAAILVNALRVTPCDLGGGIAFFLLLPALSLLFGVGNGLLWGLAMRRASVALALAWTTVLASALWAVWRIYDTPGISAYDPFFGYFAGALYDEDVAVRWPLIWARLYHLAWLVVALFAASALLDTTTLRLRLHGPRLSATGVLGLLLSACCAVSLTVYSAHLGFNIDSSHIRRELGGIRRTAHFEIVYPKALRAAAVQRLAEDHEFRYAQLVPLFGHHPTRIRSYIFADSDQKRRMMGAARTFIAKPWRNEMYLQYSGFPQRALKHELAHVMAARHGDVTFGVSFSWRGTMPRINMGLIEGLAVAADWRPILELTGHQRAAALMQIKRAPSVSGLFGLGFFAQAGHTSYGLAGSFCRYLLEQYGKKKLLAAYGAAGDFHRIYGKSLSKLIEEWQSFLRSLKVPTAQLQLIREYHRRPAIFSRACPHDVANLSKAATSAQTEGEFGRACTLRRAVIAIDPHEPAHLFSLMQAEAAANGPEPASALARRLFEHRTLSKPLHRRALELLGDLHWLARKPAKAKLRYAEAASFAASPGGRRTLSLKRWALTQKSPLRTQVLDYLVTPPGKRRNPARDIHRTHEIARVLELATVARPDTHRGLGHYLLGKALANRDLCQLALQPMQRALRDGLPDRDFRIEAHRVLGYCAYETKDLEMARLAYSKLKDIAQVESGTALMARDWLARIHWRQHATLPHTQRGTAAPATRLDKQ